MSLTHIVRRMNQHLGRSLREHGSPLDDCQLVIMEEVSISPGASQTRLIDATHVDRSTLSSTVRRLAKKKLVTRKRDRLDARAFVVTLTPEGETALIAALAAKKKAERDLVRAYPFLQAAE